MVSPSRRRQRTILTFPGDRGAAADGVSVAVYVVFVTGACMVWLFAPPSDHEVNSYTCPPIVCGDSTAIVLCTPTTLVNVNGVAIGAPSRSTELLGHWW